jgi:hypothetical protein
MDASVPTPSATPYRDFHYRLDQIDISPRADRPDHDSEQATSQPSTPLLDSILETIRRLTHA